MFLLGFKKKIYKEYDNIYDVLKHIPKCLPTQISIMIILYISFFFFVTCFCRTNNLESLQDKATIHCPTNHRTKFEMLICKCMYYVIICWSDWDLHNSHNPCPWEVHTSRPHQKVGAKNLVRKNMDCSLFFLWI